MSGASNGGEVPGTPSIQAGRFVLVHRTDTLDVKHDAYVTSWDTWEDAEVAFEYGRMPAPFKLIDCETGRVWHPGASYEWEAAQT